jgi:hypothetical protein
VKRPLRWIFNGFAAISVLILLASSFLWIRSYWKSDIVYWNKVYFANSPPPPPGTPTAESEGNVSSSCGYLSITWNAVTFSTAGPVIDILYNPHQGVSYVSDNFTSPPIRPGPTPGAKPNEKWIRWNCAGIQYVSTVLPDSYETLISIRWPYIVAFALCLPAWKALAIAHNRRRAARVRHGLCPTCGYDLRATPNQCPECGKTMEQTTSLNTALR